MTYTPKDWMGLFYSILAVTVLLGTASITAGDIRWNQSLEIAQLAEKLNNKIDQKEINKLDRDITFLQIKIDEGESTSSDRIYIKTLQQQLRALKAARNSD